MIYDQHSDIDQRGSEFFTSYRAVDEAVLTRLTKALDAQVFGKPSPRQVAVVEGGKIPKVVAIRDVT